MRPIISTCLNCGNVFSGNSYCPKCGNEMNKPASDSERFKFLNPELLKRRVDDYYDDYEFHNRLQELENKEFSEWVNKLKKERKCSNSK